MARTRIFKVGLMLAVIASVTASALAFLLVPRLHASADTGLVTRGDAETIFHSGCGEAVNRGTPSQTNPCEDRFRAHIGVFFASGAHLCADDWHVLVVYDVESVDPTNPLLATRALVVDDLQATTTSWTLDGVPMATETLPIKAVPAAPQQSGTPTYSYTNGTLLAPDALSVGPHTFTMVLSDPAFPTPVQTRTFIIDPSGTGRCLQP